MVDIACEIMNSQQGISLVPHKVAQQMPQLAHAPSSFHQPQLATWASCGICKVAQD